MKVKFSRCLSSNLYTIPLIDGQLICCVDTGEIYKDYGDSPTVRIKLNSSDSKYTDVIDKIIDTDEILPLKSDYADIDYIVEAGNPVDCEMSGSLRLRKVGTDMRLSEINITGDDLDIEFYAFYAVIAPSVEPTLNLGISNNETSAVNLKLRINYYYG